MNIGEYCPSQYIILHSQAALDNILAITFGILPGQDHVIIIIILSVQNITVPNITTYTKYNNIFYVNLHGNPAYSLVYKKVTF
jgi:hypothetical protein